MKKIEKLTPEQEIKLKQKLEEWLAIGRSTSAINREDAEKSITAMYTAINKPKPLFFWFPSPLQCMLGIAATKIMAKDLSGDNLRANLWDNLRANLMANLWENLSDNLIANLRNNLWANLWENLSDNLSDNLRANLRANLGDNLRDNLGHNLGVNLKENLWANLWDNLSDNLGANLSDNLRDNLDWNYFGGNLWCAWEVFYDFCNEIGIPYSDQNKHLLDLWLNQSRSCHFWWPYENMVFLSEKPASLTVDEMGRLHCENDAALYYNDGYGLYHWHGVRVPKWVIEEPNKITLDIIEKETNSEIKRVMITRYGAIRYLQDSGAQEIHRDRDTKEERILYRKESNDIVVQMVKVINSTPEPDGSKNIYFLRVPPDITTAKEGIAWTFGMTADQYNPTIET